MGYYVDLIDSNWVVPETETVFNALAALNQLNDIKNGGSYGPEGQISKWFSWMPENYDTEMSTVREVLEALGFTLDVNEEITVEHPYPRIAIVGYSSKTGQEDVFVAAMVPFVKDGSYLAWRGEEGEHWMWQVQNGKLMASEGRIVYDDFREFDPIEKERKLQAALEKIRSAT